MTFIPPYDINPDPLGDTVSVGIEKNEGNILRAYEHLNLLLSMIESVPATGEQILAALEPVDGISSGLDAEYLGGRIYSEYGLAIHTHAEATQSAPGFLAAIDKQKLDGMNPGAEPNVQSDWAQTSSSDDAYIRNKPKIVGTTGVIESGDVGVFYDATTLEGKNPTEMKSYLDYFETGDFLETSSGAADAGKPVVLDPTGLIHASMIPAVPAQAIWGGITGTLSNQTDLQAELDLKASSSHNHHALYLAIDGKAVNSDLLDGKNQTDFEFNLGNPANDGEVLSSTAAGVRSWVPSSSSPDWGSIGGTLSNQTDLQAELDARHLKTDFISSSSGSGDAGKPIVLGSNGQIDPSMMDVSVFYYVGSFTPVAGTEYPDTTGESHGAFWVVQGVDAGTGYTFAGGDLSGLTVNNGDFMVYAAAGWSIMAGEMNPMLYYKLDGSQPLTNNFQAGGFKLKNLADPTELGDAVTQGWAIARFIDAGGDTMTGNLTISNATPNLYLIETDSPMGAYFCILQGGGNFLIKKRKEDGTDIGNVITVEGSTEEEIPNLRGAPSGWEIDGAKVYTDDYHPGASAPDWGEIGGTLSNQTDLQDELDAKANASHDHVMADITDLIFPVDSVNGKTGAVSLNSTDVGALAANGKAIDSALLNGKADTAFSLSGHNHDSAYLSLGGGTLTGNLSIETNAATIFDIKCGDNNVGLLRYFYNGDELFEFGLGASGAFAINRKNGENTFVDAPLFIDDAVSTLSIPQLKGAGWWSINNAQIYTDDYHPAITDLLTEIATLKQRITALEEA